MAEDPKPAVFDGNVWYTISESRVDNTTKPLGSTLQIANVGIRVFGMVDASWQMQPFADDKPGWYLMRYSGRGPREELAICYDPNEMAEGKSVACMERSSDADNHIWNIVEWGDGTYRMHNVANGTKYALDVVPGAQLFMNPNIEGINSDVHHKAQHWIWSSMSEVNEGAYSTVFSAETATQGPETTATGASSTATTTTDSSTAASTTAANSGADNTAGGVSESGTPGSDSSSSSSDGGLSPGAAAGIGVAATLAVVGLALVGLFFWWRRRQAGRYVKTSQGDDAGHDMASTAPPSQYYSTPPPKEGGGGVMDHHQHQHQQHLDPAQTNAGAGGGYYAPQHPEKVVTPQTALSPSYSYPYEMSNQQIHEAPAEWHAELPGGYDRRGSGSGMNSVQNTPAVEFSNLRHQHQHQGT